jgi:predicted O-methyltransferase YrrM
MRKIEELWELLKDVELVQVRPSEMEAIYKHVFEFRNPTIVEIGSAHGASSIILANAAREMQGHLICIDSFPEYYYGQEKFGNYARVAFLKNLYPYRGNLDLIDKPSDQAIEYGKKNFMDFACYGFNVLFVDGDHSYVGVKEDCELYLPLLVSGGYVAFHDYNNVAFGVKQAVDEFCSGWEKESVWDLAIFKKP